jgi:hypothetical protein
VRTLQWLTTLHPLSPFTHGAQALAQNTPIQPRYLPELEMGWHFLHQVLTLQWLTPLHHLFLFILGVLDLAPNTQTQPRHLPELVWA